MKIRLLQDNVPVFSLEMLGTRFFPDGEDDVRPLLEWLFHEFNAVTGAELLTFVAAPMRSLSVGDHVEITTDEEWNVTGPDGIYCWPLGFSSKAEAEASIGCFVSRFEQQGYYSTSNRERIPLHEIAAYCMAERASASERWLCRCDSNGWTIIEPEWARELGGRNE